MSLEEDATIIVFGNTLEEKMHAITFDQQSYTALSKIPKWPNRPTTLSLERSENRKRKEFPKVSSLEEERQRGMALHFFANHELLALELMALMLLRFPEAPPAFRRGLVYTIREEQQHFQMYQERMQDFGVEFGEIPVSDFFWKHIATVPDLMSYVTAMSLTLEQANLDYSQYYWQLFQELGDHCTASLLEKVYQDEIGHVAYGVQWFRQWKSDETSDWEAYKHHLLFPLSPARAKGICFDRKGRKKAGLSTTYIQELEFYSHSKGRLPDVYYFNPECEQQLAHNRCGWTPKKSVIALKRDLAYIGLFFSKMGDIVMVPQSPSRWFLEHLARIQPQLPQWVEYSGSTCSSFPKEFTHRNLHSFQPWGWNADMDFLIQKYPNQIASSCVWDSTLREKHSKVWSTNYLQEWYQMKPTPSTWGCDQDTVGVAIHSLEECVEQIHKYGQHDYSSLVLKGAFGVAGQDMLLMNTQGTLSSHQIQWIQKRLLRHGALVLEPWLEKQVDFSFHGWIDQDQVLWKGITRFFTDSSGKYKGSFLGRWDHQLSKDLSRFIHQFSTSELSFRQWSQQMVEEIGKELRNHQYQGPFSIDALVYQKDSQYYWKPMVEINPRYTMGQVALKISEKLLHRKVGIWKIMQSKELKKRGFSHWTHFVEKMMQTFPLEVSVNQQIISGFLATSDPYRAQEFFSFALVGAEDEVFLHLD